MSEEFEKKLFIRNSSIIMACVIIMLFLTVLAFNFLGDGLRDAFDPKAVV